MSTKKKRAPKTVFILGAGFSRPRGVPTQDKILDYICQPGFPNDWFPESRKELIQYLENVYGLKGDQLGRLALEDVYTPLHQAISRGEALKGYRLDQLREIEETLNQSVSVVINQIRPMERKNGKVMRHDNTYLQSFARKLVYQKRKARTSDRFAILSLNWDVHLDKELGQIMRAARAPIPKGWMDYGCHCTAYENNRFLPPPLLAKERKAYTIKHFKLHGSFHWRLCPQCGTLFVQTDVKNGVTVFLNELECPKCGLVDFKTPIILPTFRKDFSGFHFQHIWNQAGIELSEAARLVFIGYSFPLADFDFRSLITRHVGSLKIDVVLHDENRPSFKNAPALTPAQRKEKRDANTEDGNRYLDFFGDKIGHIYYEGVQYWVEHHMDEVLP